MKQFYSWYIDTKGDLKSMHPETFRKYISPDFTSSGDIRDTDPYLLSTDFPTTFKIGVCKEIDPQTVDVQVQLYWRSDAKTVQKEVNAQAVKSGDAWLINNVSN